MVWDAIIRNASHWMPVAMTLWATAGAAVIVANRLTIASDAHDLIAVKEFVKDARGSDYEQKIGIRIDVFKWAEAHATSSIARWVFTAHNAALAGGVPDAAALTDAIWSHERERFQWVRFFGRYAILLGLFFTSIGLCVTLMDIGPALTAQGLNEAEWLSGVKKAMADALVGMSTAFYSSLVGIGITLLLQVLNLLFFLPAHEKHVVNLDGFVQGSLIPVFSAIAEKDRNDVIVHAMNRAEAMFQQSCEQFAESRAQYDRLYERAAAHAADLAGIRDTLTGSLSTFGERVTALAGQVDRLDGVSDKLRQSADAMGHAIEQGLSQIEATQIRIGRQLEVQQGENEKIVHSLNRTLERIDAQAQAATRAAEELVELRSALGEQARDLQALGQVQRELVESWTGLQRTFTFNEAELQAELETRRNALEKLVERMGGQVAHGVSEPVHQVLDQYLKQLNKLVDARVEETHKAQIEFNQSMDRKWEQLLSAVGAYNARV